MLAVMLLGMTLAAFQSDALAQTRRSTGTSRTTSTASRTSSRSSSSSARTTTTRPAVSKSNDNKPKASAARPSRSTTVSAQSSARQTAKSQTPRRQTTTRQSAVRRESSKPAARPAAVNQTPSKQSASALPATARPARENNVDRPVSTRPATGNKVNEPIKVTRPGHSPGDRRPGNVDNRPDRRPDPVHIRPDYSPRHRHPRDRDFMHYSAPGHYWSHHHHCYGYRVKVLPAYVHHHVYHGRSYYCYNDIWYRPYGDYYVVCRPPLGTVLAANLIADMAWTAVRMSYYYTVVNTYNQIDENNEYIAQQNAIIAQNNATIAAQNNAIAMNQAQAQAAYTLANQLGLVQSYAAAGSEYFYQDGVFYAKDASGEYKVILPPAGALVETLPEDYDMVTLSDGKEYYQVDETIYQVTIIEGKPYFEVLGQLYR